MPSDLHCPLCLKQASALFHQDKRRPYYRCRLCALVFVPPLFYLSSEDERAEYDLHDNSVTDPRYRQFLSRLAAPLLSRLKTASRGLEFGCGPGPALAAMLQEAGHQVALYDSFYHRDQSVLQGSYDFICATEVAEHLHQPGVELDRLWSLLEPGGYLGVMTKLVVSQEAFTRWHYKADPTHVCFFSKRTWSWWAERHQAVVEFIGSDVILLKKSGLDLGG